MQFDLTSAVRQIQNLAEALRELPRALRHDGGAPDAKGS